MGNARVAPWGEHGTHLDPGSWQSACPIWPDCGWIVALCGDLCMASLGATPTRSGGPHQHACAIYMPMPPCPMNVGLDRTRMRAARFDGYFIRHVFRVNALVSLDIVARYVPRPLRCPLYDHGMCLCPTRTLSGIRPGGRWSRGRFARSDALFGRRSGRVWGATPADPLFGRLPGGLWGAGWGCLADPTRTTSRGMPSPNFRNRIRGV